MGYVYADYLKPASKYLLTVLKDEGSVRYNENFYFDGKEDRLESLRKAMGFTDEDPQDISYPPIIIDWAVGQLESKGLVTTEQLPELLSDGDHDYSITLTEQGRVFIESGEEFQHWDIDQ